MKYSGQGMYLNSHHTMAHDDLTNVDAIKEIIPAYMWLEEERIMIEIETAFDQPSWLCLITKNTEAQRDIYSDTNLLEILTTIIAGSDNILAVYTKDRPYFIPLPQNEVGIIQVSRKMHRLWKRNQQLHQVAKIHENADNTTGSIDVYVQRKFQIACMRDRRH